MLVDADISKSSQLVIAFADLMQFLLVKHVITGFVTHEKETRCRNGSFSDIEDRNGTMSLSKTAYYLCSGN